MNGHEDSLTTQELAERWRVSRQRVHQRAQARPDILEPTTRGRMMFWPLSAIERYEREVLRPGGAA